MTDPSRRLEPVVRIAPAKVNLTLAVLGLRPDGFHDLHSIMVPVDHADRLSVETFSGGLVIISGTVSSWAAHDHAVAAAWSAAGVTDVDDRLGVDYSP